MGRCIDIPGQPFQIDLQLPGGVKIGSIPGLPQLIPNDMDPFQSLLQGVQPALGAIKPAFDIIGFVMQLLQCMIGMLRIFGALAIPIAGPTNPLAVLFPVPLMRDEETNEVIEPPIPDVVALFTDFLTCIAALFGKALKLAGLVPQLSVGVMIKDAILTAMGFIDAILAQVNSLADLFTGIPVPDATLPNVNLTLQCAGDNSTVQLEHKLGNVASLVPIFSVISVLAQIAAQPLPSVIYDVAKLMMTDVPEGFGVMPFPDLQAVGGPSPEDQKDQFLNFIEELTITGLPIPIPDLGNLADIGQTMADLKDQAEPVLEVIEMVQDVLNKLTEG